MKILAVIPARAGSKGIPNKNIRLVNGKPLIWYSINNAIKSKYVSNIIVSTDSQEVATIATQMGVGVKNRDKKLCKDDITLDAVIYDAIPNDEKYDYVITMQPTSPTLDYRTLDKAIEYAIKKKVDTLISVVNEPSLSWKDEKGVKKPNYKKRLNRQYLPPYYKETGAFVISKASIITEKTRIGNKVDVYEISEDEAIDIDNYKDLFFVASIMNKKTVAIYVNANNKRGVGHAYRALELADEFYDKPDIYYDINQTDPKMFGKTTHNIIGINGIDELFKVLKKKQYDIFINDILTTSIDYMIGLRNVLPNSKIINFEDDGEGNTKADLVINALYPTKNSSNIVGGEEYFIANKLFMFYKPITVKNKVKNVFISFGGADPQEYTDRVLNIISSNEYKNYNFICALGRAKHNIEELMKYNNNKNIEVVYDVSNMPELMSKCDIAITSRGRTSYELAILGIPLIVMAQNKREDKHGFVDDNNGFKYLGVNPKDSIIKNTLDKYINMSKEDRLLIHKQLLAHDLKNGRQRVINLINSL